MKNVPPHIRAWMETDEGNSKIAEILSETVFSETILIDNTGIREQIEEAYREAERRPAPRHCRHCDGARRRSPNGESCVFCEGTGCSEHAMTVDPSCSTCRIA